MHGFDGVGVGAGGFEDEFSDSGAEGGDAEVDVAGDGLGGEGFEGEGGRRHCLFFFFWEGLKG